MADPNLKPSKLDDRQIFQRSFDETTDRLRVDAEVTATFGTVEVVIDAKSGDNIAISDGTNTVSVTPAGELKVNDASNASIDAKLTDNYGVSLKALRTASQIGNTNGAADFNTGVSTAQTLRTSTNISDGAGNVLTSSLYSSQQALHVQSPDNVTPFTILGLLNSNIVLPLAGLNSVGFQLNPGTFNGTIVAEASVDGGVTFASVPFYDPVNSAILPSLDFLPSIIAKIVSVVPIGGSSHVRVRVSRYVSGSSTGLLRAANVAGASGAITAAAFGVVSNTILSLTNNIPLLVLAKNVNRKYAYFGNSSGSTIRLQFFNSISLSSNTGIPLISQTGFYELKGDNLFTGDVYAFSSSDVQISITEGTP